MVLRHPGKTFPLLTLLFVLGSFEAKRALPQTVPEEGLKPVPGQLAPPQIPGVNESKRILGVLPNYRTAEMSAESRPLMPEQKLRIAVKDSFDYPLVFIAGIYAGLYQAEDNHPEFGQGAKGYFSRWGTSYADQISGNMLTEGLLPILFREDPRYFRMSTGSFKKRALYAVSRVVITRTDSGHRSFNYSEVLGNGMAAGLALSYYPDSRDVEAYTENWMTQIATDAASQLLKEFWPDLKRKWSHHRHKGEQAP